VSEARPRLLERAVPQQLLRWEGALFLFVIWAFFLAIPVSIGEMGLSWDALNHHVYLGWTAEHHRFDLDYLGAGYQSFQSPYLYWPFYWMAVSGWSGVSVGIVLASLHLLVVWPLWMLARTCLPGNAVFDLAMRALAIALALLSSVVLSAFGTSMNDVLAAAPLVWAVALAMQPATGDAVLQPAVVRRYVVLSGLCAGLSVALKLSNGPLAILMPGLWLLCEREWRSRLAAAAMGSIGALIGFLLGYGYWGWLLWRYFGNPVYPFYHHWFAPLRAGLGWAG
jgi:hypothetical protein